MIATRNKAAAAAAAVALLAFALPAGAARRGRAAEPPKPKLSAETLVPTELFPETDGKKLGYPNGFEVFYTLDGTSHHWKLNEASQSVEMPPADPSAPPKPPVEQLGPTADEPDFLRNVALVRPTFVTIVFADSPEAAQQMITDLAASRENRDELAKTIKLTVNKADKDPRLGPNSLVYNREFNLGDKSGGVGGASAILIAKGNIFLRVDAMGGLRDGSYEFNEDTLEKRARDIAGYLLRKM